MAYFILILILLFGIWIGFSLSRNKTKNSVNKQTKQKEENKNKILEFAQTKNQFQNNDIEKLLGVSDATVTNYLNELEGEGKIKQIGDEGRGVYYILNNQN